MALELILQSLDGVDTAIQSLYTKQDDGTFKLEVNGVEDVTGLKNTVAATRKERDEMEAKLKQFKDIDPEKYNELLAKAKEADEAIKKAEQDKLLAEGKFEEALNSRTDTMRKEYENKLADTDTRLKQAQDESTALNAKLSDMMITNLITQAVNEAGIPRKDAIVDILSRGKTIWKLDDNYNPVAYNADGTRKIGADGRTLMSPVEWAESLMKDAPHLFEASTGGGASGSRRGSGSASNGAYTQEQLEKLSPQEYRRLVQEGKI